ncbi:disulfide bond formation protein B [Paralimibaculum aggregatum]|uniref:Disulfide bond formation protein B n=1 Tax=Paralimibaculum aggregatum TaxID=3036245 RepID=A0ABQ6LBS8_9RHOB|nr:disulfide bond formation protein B [Limibaculum sp. NKW23]GMG80851.1 disulfide bond formation protein B [Limibaculum sp. NKW23]
MTVYGRTFLAGAASALMLLAAFGFQYLGGLAPCPMCLWQRWPHAAAAVLAVLAVTAFWRMHRTLAGLGAVAMLVSAALGFYHAGVEQGWWRGLSGCVAPDPSALSADALLTQILETDIVRCDEIPWSFLGLSMAAWNAVVSLGIAVVWIWSALSTLPAAGTGGAEPQQGK